MKPIRHFLCFCTTMMITLTASAQFEVFDYPGADHTYVTGMNDLGDFVGYYTIGSNTTGFYVIGSDTNDLVYPGSANTWAHGISLDRQIVGKYNDAGAQIDNEGFMYDYNLQDYEDLTFLTIGNSNYTQVTGINDNGCWTGSFRNPTSAFMMLDCDNGFESDRYNLMATYGTCVNDYDYVGGYIIDGADYTAFFRDFAGNFELVNHPSSIKTRIFGINDLNMCVGDYGNQFGFLYDPNAPLLNHFEEITIPDAVSVTPQDINNNDQICGYFSDGNGDYHGFIIRGYDIGFRPQPDAWYFPNELDALWPPAVWSNLSYVNDPYIQAKYGVSAPFPQDDEGAFPVFDPETFPSWPLMVETFGEEQFYTVVNGVRQGRIKAFEVWKKFSTDEWKGACYGMGITSLMYYQDASAFHTKFPFMPSSIPSIFSLGPDVNVRKSINQMQTIQFGKIFIDHFYDPNNIPRPIETLAAIKGMMVDETPDYFGVDIKNTNATSGSSYHAVFPFKVEPGVDHGWWNVYVYDSNHPNDTTRHIRVHKNAQAAGGAWYYEAAANVGLGEEEWGGSHANKGFRISLPISDHLPTADVLIGPHHQNESRSTSYVAAYFAKSAEEYFVNGNDSLGYYNDQVVEGYPDGEAYFPATSSYGKPTGYLLEPAQSHSATITNAQDGSASMTVITDDGQLLGYIRNDATPAQTDEATYNAGGLTYTNPDADDKSVTLKAYLTVLGIDYNYEIKEVNCEQGAQLHVEPINSNELLVTNTGAATHYDLTISILSSSDATTFEVENVPFAADGTHHIVPFWSNLADNGIYITVDTLSVGVDDTLFLDNQALPELGLSNGLFQYDNAANNGTLSVINYGGGHLNWDIVSMPSWVTIVTGASGTDDGTVQFDVDANAGANRSGWMIINSNDANSPDSVQIWQGESLVSVDQMLDEDDEFVVYPNPVKELLTVGLSTELNNANISIRDVQGRLLDSRVYRKGDAPLQQFNMSEYDSGLYLIEIISKNQHRVIKVMKQ